MATTSDADLPNESGQVNGGATALVKTQLDITGMHCASCVAHIEKALSKLEGVRSASVNLASEKAELEIDPAKVSPEALVDAVRGAGYGATVRQAIAPAAQTDGAHAGKPESGAHEHGEQQAQGSGAAAAHATLTERRAREIERLGRKLAWTAALTIPVAALNMAMPMWPGLGWWLAALTLPVWLVAGWEFHAPAARAARSGAANMDTLVSLGTTAAYLASAWAVARGTGPESWYFDTAAVIVTLILLGRYLETRAKNRASEAIGRLVDLQPRVARVVRNGLETEVAVADVRVGEELVIRPGERIATDAVVTQGESFVNEAMLTGESVPAAKKPGDALTGATINVDGLLRARAARVGEDTTLGRIIRLVEAAQAQKAPMQKLADRVAGVFVPAVLGVAALTLAGWIVLGHLPAGRAIENAVAVLIVACPCAMGLATPTAILVATGKGAEGGVLFKSGEAIERAGRLDTIVFDKTGTLTQGRPEVADVLEFAAGWSPEKVVRLAAAVEAGSEHPLGRAVVRYAKEKYPGGGGTLKNFRAVPGKGVEAETAAGKIIIGTPALLAAGGVELPREGQSLEMEIGVQQKVGRTVLLVAVAGKLVGAIALADQPKAEAAAAVSWLQRTGLTVWMLTGDNERTAGAVARVVGIKNARWGILPAEKRTVVEELQREGRVVAMVGDGINDAPALAQADLGVAMSAGTDVAIESADVTLVGGDLRAVPRAIELGRRTIRIVRENLFWAFFYNVLLIPLAVAGKLHPMLAAGAMAFSSVFVVMNSLRLKR